MGRFANLAISPSNPPAWLRNSHTTRMLYTVLPSEAYAPNGVSMQSLMRALAEDVRCLQDGFKVAVWWKKCDPAVSHTNPSMLIFKHWSWLSFGNSQLPPGGMERENPELCGAIPGNEGWLAFSQILLQTGERLYIPSYLPYMFGVRTLLAWVLLKATPKSFLGILVSPGSCIIYFLTSFHH